jgi:hypothetical protein
MKPKLDMYGDGAEEAGLVGGHLGEVALQLAKSGAPEFTDVVLSDRGRRTITAAEARLCSNDTQKNDEDGLLLPCAASLDMGRVTRIFSERMREAVEIEDIVEQAEWKFSKEKDLDRRNDKRAT